MLLHELGHQRGQSLRRGEPCAESYALRQGRLVFERYVRAFGL